MTIASKLFFHHHRSSSRSNSDEATELDPQPRRSGGRDSRRTTKNSVHRLHKSSSQVSVVNEEGHGGKYNFDERLPETVKQARERLLSRFRSINLIGNIRSDSDTSEIFTKKPLKFSGLISGPKRNFSTEIENECSICLEKFIEEEEILTKLKCKHIFHSVCLEKWVFMRNDCPYCRACVEA